MTLDINFFRPEKGGDPDKIRKNQERRFADPTMVDKVVKSDEEWWKARHMADNWNKMKNMASKAIGEKMKVRERLLCNRHATIASALEGNLRVIECKWDSESEFLIMPIFDVVYNKTFICKPYVDSLIFHQIAVCSIATEVLASSRQGSRKAGVSLQGGKVEAGTIKATWNAHWKQLPRSGGRYIFENLVRDSEPCPLRT